MSTIRLRTIEGRRMRNPAHPKRPVIATGTVFDVPVTDVHWMRRLAAGDVEEVKRKVRVAKGREVTLPAGTDEKPVKLGEGKEAEVSVLDPHWRLALARGDAELVPDDEKKPVSAPAAPPAANAGSKPVDKE